jgi:glycosyltransferase involved in cell wall biosynthesis
VNLLFVNYGDFTTNSLNHIAGFASTLIARGHACAVAVPHGKDTVRVILDPKFRAVTYEEALADPAALFPDHRPADLLHVWTPREVVRKFVIAYQRLAPTRLIVHLEDNEEFLIESYLGRPMAELRPMLDGEFPADIPDGLPHPLRYRNLLRLADGITIIVDTLRRFVPPHVPVATVPPGIDFSLYQPQPADPAFRAELGLTIDEKVLLFTGGNSHANEPELKELYHAVHLLNQRGLRTRLVRTGPNSPEFVKALGVAVNAFVLDLGFVEKARLPKLLALADVLVQPGRPGPFNDYRLPSKVPEFLAMRKPVVLPASNVGLALRDGEDALLLRSGTAWEIAEACVRIFADPGLAAKLGQNALTFARGHFNLADNTTLLADFYNATLNRDVSPLWLIAKNTAYTTDVSLLAEQLRRQLEGLGQTLPASIAPAEAAADLVLLCRQLEAEAEPTHAYRRKLEAERDRWTLREVKHLHDLLSQRDAKIRAMQSSFSWQATAPLRALRRTMLDRYRQKHAPQPEPARFTSIDFPYSPQDFEHATTHFCFSFDRPHLWNTLAGQIEVQGWCFTLDRIPLKAVRARVGDRIFPGLYGQARPDIAAQYPQFLQAACSGFKIDLTLCPNDPLIAIEVGDGNKKWHPILTRRRGPDSRGFDYTGWINLYDTLTPQAISHIRAKLQALKYRPLISVLMPVYNPPGKWLARAIDSVRSQIYDQWELCIADDASTDPHVRPLIEKAAREDPRIKVIFRETNGHISAASNSALELASGEFTALLDHDDELAPHALLCCAETILAHTDAEIIYSDEDKIDEQGFRFDPHFKPDWNPDLLTGQNYFCHLSVYRTGKLRAIGGFRNGFEGSQDWDVALRMIERVQPQHIHHIPRVLYHWRAVTGSTARHLDEKDYASRSARKTIEEHFIRTGQEASLRMVDGRHWRVQFPRPAPPPLVTLIIPTRNGRKLLATCVESIFAKTSYPNFEILVADNDSDDPELIAFYERLKSSRRFNVLPCPGPFNFSAINNRAVKHANGKIIGLLNNDLEIIHPEWLDEMVSHAVRAEIGAVGAKLYYPDFRIQHAGVITGLGGVAGHAFKHLPHHEPGIKFRPHLVHNVSAVTAACLVIRRAVYLEAGGFDENIAVAFNDVDFCLKVQSLGYRNLYTPFAELIHHESASRGVENTPDKIRRFQKETQVLKARWGDRLLNDPAYNPNFSLDSEDFALAYPPRVPALGQLGPV